MAIVRTKQLRVRIFLDPPAFQIAVLLIGFYFSSFLYKLRKQKAKENEKRKETTAIMWRRALMESKACQSWRVIATRGAATGSGKHGSMSASTVSASAAAVDSLLLRSLKDHYLEVSKMTPPPKVSPPSPFTIIKGGLDSNGPVLKRTYGKEEINIFVMRLANIIRGEGDDPEEDGINQLFLHVDVSKPGQEESLQFLCGLYPDALGIHSVSMRPKLDSSEDVVVPSKYNGPVFEDLDENMRDALHSFIEERGVNESLFPFLQAWLYVKDHRNLLRWFKSVGTFITEKNSVNDTKH
ncbi:mitochondrial acidic protein MAM33 isoform X2 [Durio zibethinus]|uniref:Mitochondrial acidic protein MAM33 isoform X2 n=1 Tax=Durio zibethinus TaxID=66656 RepID=A0A6P5Y8D6_DURZI|nr:mitochondrial acidic protein MAM33 isoform X2 [Durio zibethinus]